jgi:hypothetical protein
MKARAAVLKTMGSAVCALLFSSLAYADPIVITSGALVASSDNVARFDAHGKDFSMTAISDFTSGLLAPWSQCLNGCAPGIPIDLFANWSGSDFGGTVTIDGTTFPLGIHTTANYFTDVFFTGSVLAPAFDGRTAREVSAPFSFAARLDAPIPPPDFPAPDTSHLIGRGTATLRLRWTPDGWSFNQGVYAFEPSTPVPEPGTMTLIALGLSGLIGRRLRRRVM